MIEWLMWLANHDLEIMVSYDPTQECKGGFYPDLWMIHISVLDPLVLVHELGHAYLYKYCESDVYEDEAMAWAIAELLWTIKEPLPSEWAKYSQFN